MARIKMKIQKQKIGTNQTKRQTEKYGQPRQKKTTKLTNFDQTVKLNTDHMDNQQQ